MSSRPSQSIFVAENLTRKRVIAGRIRSARDSYERRRGLLDATRLDEDNGLWINPCEAVHTFGMQVPLDVLFLDSRLRVRKIAAHVKPNRISFCLTADSVLEIRAGGAAATGTECGDQLVLRTSTDPAPIPTVEPAGGR